MFATGPLYNAPPFASRTLVRCGRLHALPSLLVAQNRIGCLLGSGSHTRFRHLLSGSRKLPAVTAQLSTKWGGAGACVIPLFLMGARSGRNRAVEVVANTATTFNADLQHRLTELLRKPYKSFPFLSNRHVETIFAALFRSRPQVTFRRECLRMPDGGTVALDWPLLEGQNPNGPVLVLLVCTTIYLPTLAPFQAS